MRNLEGDFVRLVPIRNNSEDNNDDKIFRFYRDTDISRKRNLRPISQYLIN